MTVSDTMGSMVQTLRQIKKERTRDALVAAGMHLFAQRGFDAVTVAEISAQADVAPRTFHRYFSDKVELLFIQDDELLETVRTALDAEPSGAEPVMIVRSVLAAVGKRLSTSHSELVIRERLLSETPVLRDRDLAKRAGTEQLVAKNMAERLGVAIDEDVRPRWWAGVAFATFAAGYQAWLVQGGELSEHLAAAMQLLESTTRQTGSNRPAR